MDFIEKLVRESHRRNYKELTDVVADRNAYEYLRLDLRFILALGTEPYLYEDIKAIYNSNKMHYYSLYKKSAHYNSHVFESYNTKANEQLIYSVALLEEDDTNILMRLMKKAYKNAYNYVNTSGRVVDGNVFCAKLLDKFVASGENMLKEIDMLNQMTAMYFFAHKLGKAIEIMQDSPLEEMFMAYLDTRTGNLLKGREIIKDSLKQKSKSVERFRKVFVKYKTKDILFENFCELTTVAETGELGYSLADPRAREYTVRQGYLSRYLAFYHTYLSILGFGEDIFGVQTITSEDIDSIALHITNSIGLMDFEIEEVGGLFISLVYLTVFSKEYRETRQSYLKKDMEENYYQVQTMLEEAQKADKEKISKAESLIHDYKVLKDHLKNVNNSFKVVEKESNAKDREIEKLTRLLEQEQQKVEQLTKENEQLQVNRDEMYAMKERICRMENILFIGGHPNWAKKLAEVLPRAQFIDIDKNMDYSFIANYEGYVIVNTATNNHGFMQGIKPYLENREYKLLNSNHGLERSIEEIYELIK